MTELTQGGRLVRLGRLYDPECGRTTHRLQLASQILRNAGVVATWPDHADACERHPDKLARVMFGYRDRVICDHDCPRRMADQNGPTWPEWVSAVMFNSAYTLADAIQTERGNANRADAERLHRAHRA